MANARELLAQNMKMARARLGYSQMKLAEKVGCSTSLIGDIEICKKFPSAENLDRIAEALALKTFQLFYEPKETRINQQSRENLARLMLKLKETLGNDIETVFTEYMQQE
jgi:transcriptional regulator with XRE-family HTH domain